MVGSSSAGRQAILLAVRRHEVDAPVEGVDEVELAVDDVVPRRRRGVLEVGEPHVGARVERVDRHLAADRPGDLDATVVQPGRHRGDPPRRVVADLDRLGEEVEVLAGRDARAAVASVREDRAATVGEGVVQPGDEVQRLRRQDLVEAFLMWPDDTDAVSETVHDLPPQNCSDSVDPASASVPASGLSAVVTRSK